MSFTVDDFHELIALLMQRPELQAVLRQQVLGPEVLGVQDRARQIQATQNLTDPVLATPGEEMRTLAAGHRQLTDQVRELAAGHGQRVDQVRQLATAQRRTEEALLSVTEQVGGTAGGLQTLRREVGSMSEL